MSDENSVTAEPAAETADKPGKVKWRQGPDKESPFMWQNKRTMRQILDSPFIQQRSTALWVYTVLTWLTSDESSCNTCHVGISLIAFRAGLSRSTVIQRLKELEAAGVIQINKRRLPGKKEFDINTYRLVSGCPTRTNARLSNDCTTLSNDCTRGLSKVEAKKLTGSRTTGVAGGSHTPARSGSTNDTPPCSAAANTFSSFNAPAALGGKSTQQEKREREQEQNTGQDFAGDLGEPMDAQAGEPKQRRLSVAGQEVFDRLVKLRPDVPPEKVREAVLTSEDLLEGDYTRELLTTYAEGILPVENLAGSR